MKSKLKSLPCLPLEQERRHLVNLNEF
uniref:Uncharacterized protein n=1 Tax=Lotus japonicus TaxID=34305 RepID=I3TAB4_LOTJA|nr:unknown [Lotus japonicus]